MSGKGRMAEAGWLACNDPQRLLDHLRRRKGPKPSERKLRLFAAACCRRLWPHLTDPRSRRALETLEQYADGLVSAAAREDACVAANAALDAVGSLSPAHYAAKATAYALWDRPSAGAVAAQASYAFKGRAADAERAAQAALVRDVFGNPFRPVRVDPAWLTWDHRLVDRLARGIYDDRAFDRLAVLADALEEAGCADETLLSHCRGPGPHVRGCWVVDLLLGKE